MTIGVLSTCHEREVRLWSESPLALLVDEFGRSSRIGAMKPDLAAFEWILDRLDTPADAAVYVGNGGDLSVDSLDTLVDVIDRLVAGR